MMSIKSLALVRVHNGQTERKPISREYWSLLKPAPELVCGNCERMFNDDNHYLCLVCRREH